MPVANVNAVERPDESMPRQPGLRDRIFRNVFGIVEVDERKTRDRPVKRQCSEGECQAREDKKLFVRARVGHRSEPDEFALPLAELR